MKKRRSRKKERRLNSSEVVPLTRKQLEQGSRFFRGKECILCGEPATRMGVFRPPLELAKVLGEPPGKIRQFAYGICNDCMHKKDYPELVEEGLAGAFEQKPTVLTYRTFFWRESQ